MSMIRAVVFDIDGTLIDTREFILPAYEYSLAKNGYAVPEREVIASLVGKRIQDIYAFLAPGCDVDTLVADHAVFQAEHAGSVHAFDHVNVMIDELKHRGLKIALWTGRAKYVVPTLQAAGIESAAFDCLVDGSMVQKSKPDPEGLLMALAAINEPPEAAIMIGDAGYDIEAGRRCGVAGTIGLTHGFGTRAELEAAQADHIIDSLMEIPAILDTIEDK